MDEIDASLANYFSHLVPSKLACWARIPSVASGTRCVGIWNGQMFASESSSTAKPSSNIPMELVSDSSRWLCPGKALMSRCNPDPSSAPKCADICPQATAIRDWIGPFWRIGVKIVGV